MRKILTSLLLFSCLTIQAQQGLQAIIDAEKSFAAMSVAKGIRQSFTANFDTACVIFRQGKLLNGYQAYSNAPEQGTVLQWEPSYAGIASSGDLGFTTGPYTFRKSATDSIAGRGQFCSIWQRNANNEWKVVLDMGTGYKEPDKAVTAVKQFVSASSEKKKVIDALMIENNFINAYKSEGAKAFNRYITEDSWFNRDGHHPYESMTDLQQAIRTIPDTLTFVPLGSKMSLANDFAYVYGNVTINGIVDNYLRVWIRKNKEWKLILQVLNW